jgi:hypothetical protein
MGAEASDAIAAWTAAEDIEARARGRLEPASYDFIAGGAGEG